MPYQSTPSGQSLPHEQAQMLLQTLPLMLVVELLAAGIIGWMFRAGPAAPLTLNLWLGAVALVTLWRAYLLRQYRQQLAPHHANTDLPLRSLLLMAISGALLFAPASPLFNPISSLSLQPDFQHRLYGIILVGLAVLGMANYAAHSRVSSWYVLILLVPPAAMLGWQAWRQDQLYMGALLPLLIAALLIAGRRIHNLIMRSLRIELRNRSLIQFLENARNDAEQLSEKLAREVFDRREARQRLQEAKNRLEQMVSDRTQALEQANRELSSTGQRLQLALDASRIAMWEWNIETNVAFQANLRELLGYNSDGTIRSSSELIDLIHPDDIATTNQALVHHLKGHSAFYQGTYRMRHADGHWVWIEDHGQVVARDANQNAKLMIGTRRDVTEARMAEEQNRLAASVFENAPEGIEIFDPEMKFLTINESFTSITGFTKEDVVGQCLLNFGDDKNRALYADIFNTLQSEGVWHGEIMQPRKNGEIYPMQVQLHAVYNDNNQLVNFVGMFTDSSQRRIDEEKLQFLSNHDRLTGLANRNQFRETLQRHLSMARLKRDKVALLYMDLDRFKPINDTLGHEIGDAVLKQCAQRLIDCGLESEQVARIDGDEFTVLLPHQDQADVEALCQRMIQSIKQPFNISGHELLLGTSIGISLYPDSAKDARTMISQSDIAMHQAKRMGGNTYQYYSSDMRMATVEQLALETSLRKALSRNEFVVYYQPKLDMADGVIRGAEALIRWQHPTMGLLMPGTFIPLAEEAGLITEIGEWVLFEAARQTAHWHHQDIASIATSVNLSAQQFRSSDIVELVRRALKETSLPAHQLEMELTETLLMDDLDSNIAVLKKLRKLGVGLSLDDFGTGYSSLSYLKRFPIDELKIDRAFVMDLEHNKDDAAIVQAIITMAHSLRLRVVAEGVETQPQLEQLRAMGCDTIQGYLISKPVPAAEMEVLLFQQRHRYKQS